MTGQAVVVILAALLGAAAGTLTQLARTRGWRLKALAAAVALAILVGLHVNTVRGGTILPLVVFVVILAGSYAFTRTPGRADEGPRS